MSAQLERDRLIRTDRPTEGDPFAGVCHGVINAALDHPHRQSGDRDATFVENLQELGIAPATLAEQVVLRHSTLDERQAVGIRGVPSHLAVRRLYVQARCSGGDDDRRDLAGIGQRGDGDDRRDRRSRIGDERLLTIDDPLPRRIVEDRPGASPSGVTAGVRFGQPERPEGAAGAQVR